ncbi:MarR family winged helix-turn-helix transcriptional regulator [Agilicoccus flavus]|uniref:MarR family winged helix-turn-helix transcriptional regulator n=1 Tax=Agilicoccus flavus TaxID=2775968 RepID=UPI001CF64B83|nr:MarR family transcriptional regulator [Agilicoccus flavus]
MTPSDSDAPPARLLYVVKQLELISRGRLDDVLRPTGVTTLQYTALTVLSRSPRMSSADLARLSFVRAQSTADLVSNLARQGLISRTPDPANRRRLLIDLTDAGRDLLATYDPLVADLEAEMLADFTADERDVFRDLLRRARHALALSQ